MPIVAPAMGGIVTMDNFGSGSNAFGIHFVTIGNAGNANDAGAGGGTHSSPYGGVSYEYRIGKYEISQDILNKAKASGLSNINQVAAGQGPWTGSLPASNLNWYQGAAFVNWLNTSTGHQAAYDLTWTGSAWTMNLWSSGQAWHVGGENLYRHKDAYYFLPSETEWYKAAYHKNDGVTANYWDYATGSNAAPTAVANGTAAGTAVFGYASGVPGAPAAVDNAGGLSSYGTMGQNGNVWDWTESAYDGTNNSTSESRIIRGGVWYDPASVFVSSFRGDSSTRLDIDPANPNSGDNAGFRIASISSVPEPASAVMGLFMLGTAMLARRRQSH